MKRLVFVAFFLLSISFFRSASAQSVSIPVKTTYKPATDLLDSNGKVFNFQDVVRRAENGEDLSIYNPDSTRIWQNQKYSASDVTGLPEDGATVEILEVEGRYAETGSEIDRVRLVGTNKEYRFVLSRYTHTNLFRAAFLRKLGYFVPSPKLYRRLKIKFASEEKKKQHLESLQQELWLDMDEKKWISENNTEDHSITLINSTLEPVTADYYPFYMGINFDPGSEGGAAYIDLFKRLRSFRAMILPVSLTEIPESINRYSPNYALRLAGSVVINDSTARAYNSTSWDDARWIIRRMTQLTNKDLQEVVDAGQFFPEDRPLVLAKLKHRIFNAFELFELKNSFPFDLPDLKINTASGRIKDGKITQEFTPGYPQRFAHGDRPSPFSDEDIASFFKIKGISSFFGGALMRANQELAVFKAQSAVDRHIADLQNQFNAHRKAKPNEPFVQKVQSWGGPVGGFSVNSARHLSTGTYYGSTAPIQLVDNISVGANIGYFMSLDGMKTSWVPTISAQLIYLRDYTHVRPIQTVKEGDSESWKNLMVSEYMSRLVDGLNSDQYIPGKDKNQPARDAFDIFITNLKEGEVFTVTDSLVTGAYAQVSSALDVLMGISTLNFVNSITLSADASRVNLKQVSFVRTRDGLQVYVRRQNQKVFGLQFDFNYFINLLRIRGETSTADLHTDAFLIKYDPSITPEAKVEDPSLLPPRVIDHLDMQKKLKSAVRRIFKTNNPKEFYRDFQYQHFPIDHQLKTKELKTKLLWERMSSFKEEHLVKFTYPRSKDFPEVDPKESEVILFSAKQGELKGRDLLGFGLELGEAVWNKKFKKFNLNLSESVPNPANVPFGRAYWRLVNTESDLSPYEKQYPDVAILQHVWGGWQIKRNDLDRLVGEINNQFKDVASYRLIPKEAFGTTSSLDFYKITASLSVLSGGLEKIRDLLLQTGKPVPPLEKHYFLSKFFQKISEAEGSARGEDKAFYSDLITLIGGGDYQMGLQLYNVECQNYTSSRSAGGPSNAWLFGTAYNCLTPWMDKLIRLSRSYPQKDRVAQTRWATEVLYVVDEFVPLATVLDYIGPKNYVFVTNIFGFRTGDEDGDLEFIANTVGEPEKDFPYANGLFNLFSRKTGISPVELDRSQASFR